MKHLQYVVSMVSPAPVSCFSPHTPPLSRPALPSANLRYSMTRNAIYSSAVLLKRSYILPVTRRAGGSR